MSKLLMIIVWVCPTKECGNYYASSKAGNLSNSYNYDLKNIPTFNRSRCPDCEAERVPTTFEVK